MELLIIFALILLNGFFSLSEIALVSSRKIKLKQLEQTNNGARTALKLGENSEKFLSAIQIGITLIGIVTGAYGGTSLAEDIEPFFHRISFLAPYADEIAMVAVITFTTYISIVIGELVPKSIGLSNPEKVACVVAPVISVVSVLFAPVVKLLSASTVIVNSILHIKKNDEQITEEELKFAIETATDDGVIKEDQESMHKNLFYFADKRAKHLMTNRRDVEWIDLTNPLPEIEQKLLQMHHSYIVCCRDNLDTIEGIVKVKDFLLMKTKDVPVVMTQIISAPVYISETTEAGKVLELFRKTQTHFACVLNEYGEFEGIITLYDILENIVGDIPQEDEIYEPDIFVRDDKSVLVNGDASIEILTKVIDGFVVNFDEIDYSTVAGFVFNNLNDIPETGSKFEFMGYRIEVVDTDGKRVDKVLISKIK
ncbi:MAG TPA: HlyC/CorC family transporter [Treponema sp.]|nr:HlyC/CorC family transporter [Treponema sp.]